MRLYQTSNHKVLIFCDFCVKLKNQMVQTAQAKRQTKFLFNLFHQPSTANQKRQVKSKKSAPIGTDLVERITRLELATSTLARWRSTR